MVRVTRELRESTAKMVAGIGEQSKKRLRDVRQKVLESCKEEIKDLDTRKQSERELQAHLEKATSGLEKLLSDKQKELLTN